MKKMKRRTLGLLAGASTIALRAGHAWAQMAASSLGAGLTPMGSEIAGNADGSIPAWSGGLTSLPTGIEMITAGQYNYVPELFPNEQPVLVIDQGNVADNAALLSDGVQAMMKQYGYKIKVYPTRRTAAFPQWVYDNISKNHSTAHLLPQDPVGGRLGFGGGFGGIPFPVPDTSNPLTAGGQIMWNHNTLWRGPALRAPGTIWAVAQGQKILAANALLFVKNYYFNPNGPGADYNGSDYKALITYSAPQNLVGQQLLSWNNINPYENPNQAWELLNGQGRVRRAPEIAFDTPSGQSDGIANFDEFYGFSGSLEKYDWKFLGKQEMYVPYNNNGLFGAAAADVLEEKFLNPDLVRWERHRCWVVEATLHPGERNVLAKRRVYVDEDTMVACMIDAWDANDNLFKVNLVYNYCRPDLPGVVYASNSIHNLQTGDYTILAALLNQSKQPTWEFVPFDEMSDLIFDPTHMAASAQY